MKYIVDVPEDTMYVTAFVDCGDGSYCTTKNKYAMQKYVEPNIEDIEDKVWEFAGKIYYDEANGGMQNKEFREAFYGENAKSVLIGMSYREAKAKYDEWLNRIRNGDEVELLSNNRRGVVVGKYHGLVGVLYIDHDIPFIFFWDKQDVRKTGRHFPEVAKLLEGMEKRN